MTALKVHVDYDKCESYGVCVAASPRVFDLNDDDELIVLDEKPSPGLIDSVKDALVRCPKRAIELH
jgi:ferredoxin